MRIIVEQDPGEAGAAMADRIREVLKTGFATTVDVETRTAPRLVDAASDDRTANNAVRHQYRVLGEAEKAQMVRVKDAGATFLLMLEELRTPPEPVEGQPGMAMGRIDRELNIACERIEEAVMWAVKHVTA